MSNIHKDIDELLALTRENNAMLKFIVDYINLHIANADKENMDDFVRNIVANLLSNGGRV